MATYTPYQEIVSYANTIPCLRTQKAVMRIADELSEGTFENKIQGVAVTATAAELNKLDAVAVTATEMDQRVLTVKAESVSVAKSVYTVVPWDGSITTIYACGDATTIGGPPPVFSFGGNGVAMSGNIITVTTGATVGASYGNVSPTSANALAAGQVLRISADGGATGPAMNFVFTVLMDIT